MQLVHLLSHEQDLQALCIQNEQGLTRYRGDVILQLSRLPLLIGRLLHHGQVTRLILGLCILTLASTLNLPPL